MASKTLKSKVAIAVKPVAPITAEPFADEAVAVTEEIPHDEDAEQPAEQPAKQPDEDAEPQLKLSAAAAARIAKAEQMLVKRAEREAKLKADEAARAAANKEIDSIKTHKRPIEYAVAITGNWLLRRLHKAISKLMFTDIADETRRHKLQVAVRQRLNADCGVLEETRAHELLEEYQDEINTAVDKLFRRFANAAHRSLDEDESDE